ncbi:Stk1 family PASTA domain-containing Ser/Thr kinase [Clostridium sardiniense]|uniref:Stk1 family PASTA domain-containing Ser/Thr kinase n=1 Tax=Clostridium sardiniense TaxID=29369 RepID=UPI003D34B65C
MNGEILGDRYELLEQVGEGGMAIVYKARCNKLNRYVAVKILKAEYSDNEEIVSKFKKEATAIAKLSDNNIVNVLDVGTQGDTNYIVMELVNGKTLKEVIEQFGKVSYDTAITIAIQVAKALDCAHKNNIIHRDIKPQNILVTEDGLVKVTDFGIAKSSDSATLTNTSTILGSAHYFSPEQAKGSFIDDRTDIYSLGVVMYEMLTGKVPFEADSPVTIALKHLQEQVVPPKELNSKIPESLNKVVLKCMEKDANKRYQDVKELISDLEKIKENPDVEIGAVSKIGNNTQATSQHTIVMDAIKEPIITKDDHNDLEDEYYDDEDDEYYDDEDDGYYDESEDDHYEEEKKPKKKDQHKKSSKGIIIGIAAVVIIALLGVGGYFMLSGGSSPKKVNVPNLVGMTFEEAQKEASSIGLKVVKIKEVKSDKKAGTVLETDPKAGESVNEGTTINVTVSGEEKAYMPNVVEDTLNDAKAKLNSIGITNINVTEEYSDSISAGKVISQDPSNGSEVTKDTTVNLVVSKGKKTTNVTIPSLNGLTEREARDKLSALGLSVDVQTSKTTDPSLKDKVIDSSPKSGASVEKGSKVILTVGTYTEENVDIMSKVSGMSFKNAVKELAKYNITATIQDGYDKDGNVVSSSPSSVKPGGSVTLTTDKEKTQQIDDSRVIGKTFSDASSYLVGLGYKVHSNPGNAGSSDIVTDMSVNGKNVTLTIKKDDSTETGTGTGTETSHKDNKNK